MAEIEVQKSEEYIAWLQREEVRLYEEQQNKLAQQQQLDEELARKMSTGVASPIEVWLDLIVRKLSIWDGRAGWKVMERGSPGALCLHQTSQHANMFDQFLLTFKNCLPSLGFHKCILNIADV